MSICTFFGHRDCPQALCDLILEKGVDCFYVGNQGAFDALVRKNLQELTKKIS